MPSYKPCLVPQGGLYTHIQFLEFSTSLLDRCVFIIVYIACHAVICWINWFLLLLLLLLIHTRKLTINNDNEDDK